MPPSKQTPTVIHLNRHPGFKGRPVKKHGPEPFRKGGAKDEGPPASRKSELDPESFHIALALTWGIRLRVDQRSGSYILDGEPIALDPLMRTTNKLRKACGQPQIGKNPAWLV